MSEAQNIVSKLYPPDDFRWRVWLLSPPAWARHWPRTWVSKSLLFVRLLLVVRMPIKTFRSQAFSNRMQGTFRTHIPTRADAHDHRDSKYVFQSELGRPAIFPLMMRKAPCRSLIKPHQRCVDYKAALHAQVQCSLECLQGVIATVRIAGEICLTHAPDDMFDAFPEAIAPATVRNKILRPGTNVFGRSRRCWHRAMLPAPSAR
jgi:hypothetical protein